MTYKGEDTVRRLKQARADQGLSQRALAQRSGLTQGHISQIENGSTEPGLSSLIDLARALDLEVMLIPRKRVPAVSSLIEARTPVGLHTDPAVRRELAKGEAIVEAITRQTGPTAPLDRIREALMFFRVAAIGPRDLDTVIDVFDALKHRQDGPEVTRRVREAAETLWDLRNRLAHGRTSPVRAAYALDDEDKVDG